MNTLQVPIGGTTPRSRQSNSNYGNLRKTETMFLIMIVIFVLLSVFTNILHEFDISSSSTFPLPHPSFAGVLFHRKSPNSAVAAVHEPKVQKEESKTKNKFEFGQNGEIEKDDKKVDEEMGKAQEEEEESEDEEEEEESEGEIADKKNAHNLGGLSCAAYGGPSDEIAAEMVYWRDIPQDSDYMSPFKHKKKDGPVQYMTFEPDGGGWNNIRYVCLIYVSLYRIRPQNLK